MRSLSSLSHFVPHFFAYDNNHHFVMHTHSSIKRSLQFELPLFYMHQSQMNVCTYAVNFGALHVRIGYICDMQQTTLFYIFHFASRLRCSCAACQALLTIFNAFDVI